MSSLYALTADFRAAAERLAELDVDEAVVADTLESLSGDIEAKAVNVAFVARNLEALSAAIKLAEADMAARRKSLDGRAAHLKRYLLDNMQACGITRIESPHFTLAIKGTAGAVDAFEPGLIPAQYMRTPEPPPPAPDKAAIAAAIKAGEDVPGCRLVKGCRLEIK